MLLEYSWLCSGKLLSLMFILCGKLIRLYSLIDFPTTEASLSKSWHLYNEYIFAFSPFLIVFNMFFTSTRNNRLFIYPWSSFFIFLSFLWIIQSFPVNIKCHSHSQLQCLQKDWCFWKATVFKAKYFCCLYYTFIHMLCIRKCVYFLHNTMWSSKTCMNCCSIWFGIIWIYYVAIAYKV
jgi:hypothetical protein